MNPTSILDIEFNPHKHLVHWDRINALAQGVDTAPVTLELDVCSGCDHGCAWCVDPPGSHSGRMMPTDIAQRIMDEAADLGVRGLVFKGGGESTLHPELAALLEYGARLGFEVGLVTHGGRLDNPALQEALVHFCSYVRISIDGPTPEARREIHKADDYVHLIKGIKSLIARRGDRRSPIIGGTFCLDYQRRALASLCILLGEETELDYILIRPPFCDEVGFPAPYTAEEAAILREDIHRAADNYRGKLTIMTGDWIGDRELEQRPRGQTATAMARRDAGFRSVTHNGIEHATRRCPAAPLFLVISAGGEVFGCCCLRGIKEFSYGTIDYDHNVSLRSILAGKQRKQVLARMLRTDCLRYCTHPLSRINELIEYLALAEKPHSSFI